MMCQQVTVVNPRDEVPLEKVRCAVRGMLYADDAGIVFRFPKMLARKLWPRSWWTVRSSDLRYRKVRQSSRACGQYPVPQRPPCTSAQEVDGISRRQKADFVCLGGDVSTDAKCFRRNQPLRQRCVGSPLKAQFPTLRSTQRPVISEDPATQSGGGGSHAIQMFYMDAAF